MEITSCRGQCSLEVVLVLIVLTSVVLLTQQFAVQTRSFLSDVVLSKEAGR